jgi:hypothetical protein
MFLASFFSISWRGPSGCGDPCIMTATMTGNNWFHWRTLRNRRYWRWWRRMWWRHTKTRPNENKTGCRVARVDGLTEPEHCSLHLFSFATPRRYRNWCNPHAESSWWPSRKQKALGPITVLHFLPRSICKCHSQMAAYISRVSAGDITVSAATSVKICNVSRVVKGTGAVLTVVSRHCLPRASADEGHVSYLRDVTTPLSAPNARRSSLLSVCHTASSRTRRIMASHRWFAVKLSATRQTAMSCEPCERNCVAVRIWTSYLYFAIRDSSVGIESGYGLDDRGVGVRVPVGSRIFSSPRRPDRLWGPPNLLFNGYLGGRVAEAWS